MTTKERTTDERTIRSRAEVLCAMDCLMHHLSDEDATEWWLEEGVPDGLSWDVLSPSAEREADYLDIASDMTDFEFESIVRIFACTVRDQCFARSKDRRRPYEPKAFC